MENLEKVWLRYNKITTISPEIGRLKKLKMLDLRDNKILELPAEIGELASLSIFLISGNHLKKLPEGWILLQYLFIHLFRNWKFESTHTNGSSKQRITSAS